MVSIDETGKPAVFHMSLRYNAYLAFDLVITDVDLILYLCEFIGLRLRFPWPGRLNAPRSPTIAARHRHHREGWASPRGS